VPAEQQPAPDLARWDADVREFVETTSFDRYPSADETDAHIAADDESDE